MCRQIMFFQDAAHDMLVDMDTKRFLQLHGYLVIAFTRIATFDLDYKVDQLLAWAVGFRL